MCLGRAAEDVAAAAGPASVPVDRRVLLRPPPGIHSPLGRPRRLAAPGRAAEERGGGR